MLRIVPFAVEHIGAVQAFNRRLEAAGLAVHRAPESPETRRFPADGPRRHWAEHFVALDALDAVRGSYTIIHNQFQIGRETYDVPFLQLPLTEGSVDRRYALVGVALLKHILASEPLVYGLGMGSRERPIAKLFVKFGAELRDVPFFFRVNRAGSFLRRSLALRSDRIRKALADAAARTGLGHAGIAFLNAWNGRGMPPARSYTCEAAGRFGEWSDAVWEQARDAYSFLSVRDSAILNHLYPEDTKLPLTRLRVSVQGQTAGWAVVLSAQLRPDHNHFPGMKLGSVVDCLALPGREDVVAAGATRFLSADGVDLIVSNQMARGWQRALRRCGFLGFRSNMILAAPKPLWERIHRLDPELDRVHLTRGDGDGPYNLF